MITNGRRHDAAAVIHVPHASIIIPPEVREQFVLTDDRIAHEVRLMTDHLIDELFAVSHDVATTVKFPINRLVVEPEGFESDEQESMAARGMGVVYAQTSDRLAALGMVHMY
jgi:N-formylglutamate amidohydrolase